MRRAIIPKKLGIRRLRELVLAVDDRIGEEIKWSAPGFTLREHFATFKLHPATVIQLVLHLGARPVLPVRKVELDRLASLIQWAAPDRCVLNFEDARQIEALWEEITAVLRQWIAQLPP